MKTTFFQRMATLLIAGASLFISACSDGDSTDNNSATDQVTAGTYLWPQTVYQMGTDGAETLADMYKNSGITDVYLLTKGSDGDVCYLKNSLSGAPVSDHSGRDILQEVITAMHAKDIKVHAWLFGNADKAFITTHPQSASYHFRRGYSNTDIDLNNADYTTYCQNIVKEIANNYDIDGFMFDHIRYSGLYYGWSDADFTRLTDQQGNYKLTLKQYNQLVEALATTFGYGFSANSEGRYVYDKNGTTVTQNEDYVYQLATKKDPAVMACMQMRVDAVDNFGYAMKEAVGSKNIRFACMPEVCYDPNFASLNYGQQANDKYIFNEVCPMLYSVDFNQNADWVKTCYSYLSNKKYTVLPSLQAFSPATAATLTADIEAVYNLGCRHYILFRTGTYDIANVSKANGMTTLTYYNGIGGSCGNITIYIKSASAVKNIQVSSGFSTYKLDSNGDSITVDGSVLKTIGQKGILTIQSGNTANAVEISKVKSGSHLVWNAFHSVR